MGLPNNMNNAKLMGNMVGVNMMGMGMGPDLDSYGNAVPMGAGLPSSGPQQTSGSMKQMQQMQMQQSTQSMNSLQQQAQANLRGRTASIGSIGQSPTPPQSPQHMQHEGQGKQVPFRQIPSSPGQDMKRMGGVAGSDLRYQNNKNDLRHPSAYARGPSPQDYQSSQSPQQHQFGAPPDTWSDDR
mmetsp:Transcript_51166/g.43041  ORF Transcript_51166/g.43041 Transcript_51166/m.43041 type:complete len:184 (+) Transcript_51166:2-553(+)